jgi:hypothetical protein
LFANVIWSAASGTGPLMGGIASLRIVPGTHVLTVVLGSQVLLEQKFYIGDGVNRTFTLQ